MDDLLGFFRERHGFGADHSLTVIESRGAVMTVLVHGADGQDVGCWQLERIPSALVEPNAVTFSERECQAMTPEQARVFDRVWAKWRDLLATGTPSRSGNVQLSTLADEPDLLRHTHDQNVGGILAEGMATVYANLVQAAQREGWTIVGSISDGRLNGLAARRARTGGRMESP